MFDLEIEIKEWRQRFAEGGVKSPAALDELENHLREDIARQMKAGGELATAFDSASKRIGRATDLGEEFARVADPILLRQLRLLRFSSTVIAFVFLILPAGWLLRLSYERLEISPARWMLALAAFPVALLLGRIGRHAARFLPRVTDERVQAAAALSVIFAGAIILRILWGFLAFDDLIPLQLALIWTMLPFAAFAACLVEWCARCATSRRGTRIASA